jgi:hypothetical protein
MSGVLCCIILDGVLFFFWFYFFSSCTSLSPILPGGVYGEGLFILTYLLPIFFFGHRLQIPGTGCVTVDTHTLDGGS